MKFGRTTTFCRKSRHASGSSSPSTVTVTTSVVCLLAAASVSMTARHFFLGCCDALLVGRSPAWRIGGDFCSHPKSVRCRRQGRFPIDPVAARQRRGLFSNGPSSATERERECDASNSSQKNISSSNNNINNNAPKLILPSHPDFPITSVMAPMVAASDYPFRVFLREHCGVDLTFTQMLLAKRFVFDATFRKAHLDLYETTDTSETDFNDLLPSQLECIGNPEEHRERQQLLKQKRKPLRRHGSAPLVVQLAGDNVDEVVRTAMMIYDHTEGKLHGIDLNCGCPQNIAKKGNYGAFLMERDPETVTEILGALRRNLPPGVCVSAKIRLPADDGVLVKERIPRLMESGIDFLTVHGRTLRENKTKVLGAHADRIKLAVDTAHKLDPSFPIIANGGMEHHDDVRKILQSTGASAAMSAEALLETPDLFLEESRTGPDASPEDRFRKQLSFAKNYLEICTLVGPPLPGVLGFNKGGSFSVVRGHLFKFLHRYINIDHHDLRNKLAANGVTTMRTLGEARSLVEELESRYEGLTEEQWSGLGSSSSLSSWYRRHRKSGSSVHVRHDLTTSEGKQASLRAASTGNPSTKDRTREIKERLAKVKAKKSKRLEQNAKQLFV